MLRNTAYVGVAFYNKTDSKTRERRDESEWIPIPVPPLISPEDFETVQSRLVERRPTNRAARETTTNNLLIGLAKCGCGGDGCGGGMVASTGKSGQYQYYACSNRARAGTSVCKGRRIGRSKLDNIVLDALESKLLNPERLRDLLSGWLDHSSHAVDARREKLRQVRTRQTNLEAGLDRLLDLVIEGKYTASNPQFSRKHGELVEQIAQVKADAILLERQLANSERRITPELIVRFGEMVRAKLRGDDASLRQYYTRAIVSRVEVGDDQIKIVGSTKALEHAVGGAVEGSGGLVPSIEREWRTRHC